MFSVKAVETPSPQTSPFMRPYVSPQIAPQPGHRVPPMSLTDEHPPSKRVGTDPTKYKTTICRNWEQTGTCTFRGCTFAHGMEELRAPTRAEHQTPHLHSQYASPMGTPPLSAVGAAGANHFAGTGSAPPKLEALLEMLQTEVMRERELVTVHMEANRTLEGMLRREQLQHEETRAQLESSRLEYAAVSEVVNQQNEMLRSLLQQQSSSWTADSVEAPVPGTDVLSADDIRALMVRAASALSSSTAPAHEQSAVLAAANEEAHDGASEDTSGTEEQKENEQERIEELLRALQQQLP